MRNDDLVRLVAHSAAVFTVSHMEGTPLLGSHILGRKAFRFGYSIAHRGKRYSSSSTEVTPFLFGQGIQYKLEGIYMGIYLLWHPIETHTSCTVHSDLQGSRSVEVDTSEKQAGTETDGSE